MRRVMMVTVLLATVPGLLAAQLRKIPRRFAFVQPAGLLVGIGTAGLELAIGRRTTVELGVLGVYSALDDVQLYGGGAGAGLRTYFRSGEPAGLFGGIRLDGLRLVAEDNFGDRASAYLGLGGVVGYRWAAGSGLIIEPIGGYEALIGPRPLIPRSRRIQDHLGLLVGIGVGWSW